MTPMGAPSASHTTTTLICALDNRAATSTSSDCPLTARKRERATASMLLTSAGATVRASAAATGGLSGVTIAATDAIRGVGSAGSWPQRPFELRLVHR